MEKDIERINKNMTVKELISKLSELDPELEILSCVRYEDNCENTVECSTHNFYVRERIDFNNNIHFDLFTNIT